MKNLLTKALRYLIIFFAVLLTVEYIKNRQVTVAFFTKEKSIDGNFPVELLLAIGIGCIIKMIQYLKDRTERLKNLKIFKDFGATDCTVVAVCVVLVCYLDFGRLILYSQIISILGVLSVISIYIAYKANEIMDRIREFCQQVREVHQELKK